MPPPAMVTVPPLIPALTSVMVRVSPSGSESLNSTSMTLAPESSTMVSVSLVGDRGIVDRA